MAVFVRFVLGLLLWTSAAGSSSQPRFIQTNRDLLMTVPEGVREEAFFWRFNNNKNIVRSAGDGVNVNPDYKGRIEFFPQNLSLIIKNVQLSDSGVYAAVVSRDEDEILAAHDVTVQAPVSPVQLSVDSVSVGPDSCNFTVSCRTERSSVGRSFSCDRHACEEPRPLTPDPAPSPRPYLSGVSIVCNHSNHVSWRNDTKDIQRLCPLFGSEDLPVAEAEVRWCLVKTVVFSVGLLLMVSALIAVHVLDCIRKKNK